jgi:ADP-ribosylglycohydrolase
MTLNRRNLVSMIAAAPAVVGSAALANAASNPQSVSKTGVAQNLQDRIAGGLWAMAIGDGMGAPVEGWEGARIRDQFGQHDFTTFLPPTDPAVVRTGIGKGNGRITDDMIMIEALMRGYEVHRDHLDPYTYARLVIDDLGTRKIWVPEKQAEMTALERPVWWPERYAYHALIINNADPRTAGQGNWPQQGLMGMVLPTGAINAGDPQGAYREVIHYGVAHQHSFGLEAAAVAAACFAEAFGGTRDPGAIIAAGRRLAQDGTALAIDAVTASVDPADDYPMFEKKARDAYRPYFGLPPTRINDESATTKAIAGTNAGAASRIAAVENLTAGMAALLHGDGDFVKTMKAAIFYGQDNESIAAFALGLLGASRGKSSIPPALIKASALANRRDYDVDASSLAKLASEILRKDEQRLSMRRVSHSR